MAPTPSQFLQNLLQNITDYYTATYSSDTDLYQILRMYSRELASGSIALETVRNNVVVTTCERSQLFNNFGSFFDATKFGSQTAFEDRYLSSSGSATRTAPTIYEDVTSIDVDGAQVNTTSGEWPYSLSIPSDAVETLVGVGMTAGVLWSGSFYSTCFANVPAEQGYGNYSLLVRSRIGSVLEPISYDVIGVNGSLVSVTTTPVEGLRDSLWDTVLVGEEATVVSSAERRNAPFALTTYKKYLGNGQYSGLPEHEYLFFCRINETSLVAAGTATYPPASTDRLVAYRISPTTALTDLESTYNQLSQANLFPGPVSVAKNAIFVNASDSDSTTRAVTLNGKIYFGIAIEPHPSWTLNEARVAAGYEPFPTLAASATKRYPQLFSFDTVTETLKETGLAAYASSGSRSYGAQDSWKVGAIATHENRVYMTLKNDAATRYKMLAYRGIDTDGLPAWAVAVGTFGLFAFDLTPPSGSAIDMLEYNGDLYGLAQDSNSSVHKIVKFRHGLETFSNTVGHWRFDRNISNEGSGGGTPEFKVASDATFAGFTTGLTSAGITSFNALGTAGTGVQIVAADASDYDMASLNFTVEALVKIPKNSALPVGIVHKYNAVTGWSLSIDASGYARAILDDNSSDTTTTASTRAINDGNWHYLTMVCDRTGTNQLHIYVDSYDVSSPAIVTGSVTNAGAPLELMNTTIFPGFSGIVDEICITKGRALTSAEIANRFYQITQMGGHWITQKTLNIPLHRLHVHGDKLFASGGGSGLPPWAGYLNTSTGRWEDLTLNLGVAIDKAAAAAGITRSEVTKRVKQLDAKPKGITSLGKKGGKKGLTEQDLRLLRDLETQSSLVSTTFAKDFVSSGSALFAMTGGSWEEVSGLFTPTTWRYVYPGTFASSDVVQPGSIPGYRKQLDFLMDGAVHGGTIGGMNRAVQSFTLITPDIRETSTLPGWKLQIHEGLVLQTLEDKWQFSGSTIRSGRWQGSLATFYSGSTPQDKLAVEYIAPSAAFGQNEIEVDPLLDDNLLWDLRRIEE